MGEARTIDWAQHADIRLPDGTLLIGMGKALDLLCDATIGPLPEATANGHIQKSHLPTFASTVGEAPKDELTSAERDWLELTWSRAGLPWPEQPTKAEWEAKLLPAFLAAADRPDWSPVCTWGLNREIAERARSQTRRRYETEVLIGLRGYGRDGLPAPAPHGHLWSTKDIDAALSRSAALDTSDTELARQAPSLRGVERKLILSENWPLHGKFTQNSLNEALSTVPKWLEPARATTGKRGGRSATWNPALLADCLATRGYASRNLLTRFLAKHFSDFLSDWQQYSEK